MPTIITKMGHNDLIHVPYVSQLDSNIAGEHNNDCGPTCVSMVIGAYTGEILTPNRLYNEVVPHGDTYTDFNDLKKLVRTHLRMKLQSVVNSNIDFLRSILSQNKPVIALIDHGIWLELGYPAKSKFKGPHFVVLIGFGTFGFYVFNPLDYNIQNQPVLVKNNDWFDMWNKRSLPNNPVRALLIPELSIQEWRKSTKQSTIDNDTREVSNQMVRITIDALNVQSSPTVANNYIRTVHRGDRFAVMEEKKVAGDTWVRIGVNEWIAIFYNGQKLAERI